jgi:glycosyltransferase involved in cell wall biosynthesis
MFVVAYLYNNNGMASWCWEIAHALHEIGQPVLLVCSTTVDLPGQPSVDILRFDPEGTDSTTETKLSRFTREFRRLSDRPSPLIRELDQVFQKQGVTPTAYLLNQSDLQDSRVNVPQYVVAWAYPTSLRAYLGKIGKQTEWRFSTQTVRTFLDAIGWWRKDWRAYKQATSVLPVSKQLGCELTSKGVINHVIYPGTSGSVDQPDYQTPLRKRLLMAAVNLEEPRKRIRWMIQILKSIHAQDFSITLVGQASPTFQEWVGAQNFPVTFTGLLPRDQLQKLMRQHDIFLFGSCLDDWGYIQVEAMSQGLIVVVPKLSPFDEIVGDAGMLYSSFSAQDFKSKVLHLLASDLQLMKQKSWESAKFHQLRQVILTQLRQAILTKFGT